VQICDEHLLSPSRLSSETVLILFDTGMFVVVQKAFNFLSAPLDGASMQNAEFENTRLNVGGSPWGDTDQGEIWHGRVCCTSTLAC